MKGYIYKLSSPQTDKVYIGYTTQPLAQRKIQHRFMYKHNRFGKSKEITQYDDFDIELLEEMEFNNKNEICDKEMEYIKNTPNCVNKYNTTYSVRYSQDIKTYRKEWSEKKGTTHCECGGHYTYTHKNRHFESEIHKNYLDSL